MMRATHLPRAARCIALTAGVLAAAGCGLQQGVDQPPGSSAVSPSPATAISGRTLTGAQFSWSSTHGHPVVIDFWAAWCGPCRGEQKDINGVLGSYASRGVVFLGIDERDDTDAALAYRRDLGVTYDSLPDPSEQIASSYDVAAPPTIVLVNPAGSVTNRFLGTVVGLRDALNRLLSS